MPPMTEELRRKVVRLNRQEGIGCKRIVRRLAQENDVTVSHRTVARLLAKFNETGSILNRSRHPRGKLYSQEHEEFVNGQMTETSDMSAGELSRRIRDRFGIEVSKAAVKRYRRKLGWKQGTTRYCQLISDVNKEKRRTWCELQLANNETFDDYVFTDESKIEICHTSKRSFRKEGQPVPLHPKPKHPFSVLVWAGISKRGATKLVIFNGIMDSIFYQNEILTNALMPFLQQKFPDGHQFMQDNDPKHTSRSTQAFMEENGINWVRTPPSSPDLNPIENVWHEMKHHIATRVKPRTKDELLQGLTTFWDERMTPLKCQRYINHIHKVIPKVIECNGGPSGY